MNYIILLGLLHGGMFIVQCSKMLKAEHGMVGTRSVVREGVIVSPHKTDVSIRFILHCTIFFSSKVFFKYYISRLVGLYNNSILQFLIIQVPQ